MHIIFATHTRLYRQRGNTIHVTELSRELAQCGNKVTLIASGKTPYPLEGVDMIDAGRVSAGGIINKIFTFVMLTLCGLHHVLRLSRHADILYTRDALLGSCLVLLAPFIRLPLIFEVNGFRAVEKKMEARSPGARMLSAVIGLAEKISFRGTSMFICVTEGIQETLVREYGIAKERTQVVHNGVNLQLFSPAENAEHQEQLRKSLDLHPNDAIVLYLGTLQPWQDLPTLIQAVSNLELAGRDIVLLIVGDGEERERLEEMAQRLYGKVRVIFTGMIPYKDVAPYVCVADVCAMPFTLERNKKIGLSPLKLYSYLACGKPVVASNIKGFEFLEEEGLGTLVPCSDAEAFTKALKSWLEKPQKIEEVAYKARVFAQENCGWGKTAESVARACSSVIQGDIGNDK